jgi:hypothetical protein
MREYNARKIKKITYIYIYIYLFIYKYATDMKFRNKKMFRYDIPAHFEHFSYVFTYVANFTVVFK